MVDVPSEDGGSDDELKDLEEITINFSELHCAISDIHGDENTTEGRAGYDIYICNISNAAAFAADIRESSTVHDLTGKVYHPLHYNDKAFLGVMVDTGGAKGSTGGEAQYGAYCRFVGHEPTLDDSHSATCLFGIGPTNSIGIDKISFPVGNIALLFDVHIVDADALILLCIDDMDKLSSRVSHFSDY